MENSRKRNPKFDIEFGLKIQKLRTKKNICREEMGKAIGISYQQISKYELGINSIKVATLVDIAVFLKIPASEILKDNINLINLRKEKRKELYKEIQDYCKECNDFNLDNLHTLAIKLSDG